MPFSQTFIAEAAHRIRSGEIKTPVLEIVSVNLDRSIRVRFADATQPVHNGPTAKFFDRYEMEVQGAELATAADREIKWFDLTQGGRGSKIRDVA
jgi:hypothetical protein